MAPASGASVEAMVYHCLDPEIDSNMDKFSDDIAKLGVSRPRGKPGKFLSPNQIGKIMNQLSEKLLQKDKAVFKQWNEVVAEMKESTIPLVKSKIMSVMKENSLPDIFEHCVQWDILHLSLEAEFSGIVPISFFAGLSYWYKGGHFPCGWLDLPTGGGLVIY
jgi:hypothetical protein